MINNNHHNSFILQEAIFRVVAAVLHLGNIDLELSNV
jgi:myosin heavy subunit